jgi:mono/diheme cytochrome c family protein
MQDSYNRGGFLAFIFSVVFSLGFFVWVSFLHKGIDLKEIKEQKVVEAGQAAIPAEVDVSKVTNPWVSSEDMVAHGRKVFTNTCAMCHGPNGEGDGPAGASLNPKPRNFVEGKWKQGGQSQDLFKTLQVGIAGSSMVSFKDALPVVDRWALVHYIRSITKNKIADDPKQLEAFAKTAN